MKNKVVAITGAASGIGRATATRLARMGAKVAIADINEAELERTRGMCEGAGAEVVATTLDVSDREAVHAWARATREAFGKVNVIVNNAGVALGATVDDLTYEDFEWLMGINFWGVVHGTKAFLPYLRESGDGHVVNVSSLYGLMSMPCSSAYNASKFAVRGFTESLSEELLVEGAPVKVTCVHPGGIDTNIARGGRVTANGAWNLVDSEHSAERFKKLARTSPDDAAAQIVDAIEKGRRRLLIGMDARIFDTVQRVLPARYQSLVVRLVKKVQYKGEQ